VTLKPCVQCGEPSDRSRCPAHGPKDAPKVRDRGHVHTNTATWKALSKKARRLQPWCTWCGTTDDLCTDHVIPYSVAPELGHSIENCQVLCRPCNGRRGDAFTEADVAAVLHRLYEAYKLHPTRAARERIAAAERAATTRGDTPPDQAFRPVGKAQGALHT